MVGTASASASAAGCKGSHALQWSEGLKGCHGVNPIGFSHGQSAQAAQASQASQVFRLGIQAWSPP